MFKYVVANLITFIMIGFSAYFVLYYRMSGINQNLRRLIHPKRRVFALHNLQITSINRLETSNFLSPISEYEREILVKLHAARNGSNPHNGTSIRLDGLTSVSNDKQQVTAHISKVGFFDFIATNLTAYPANAPILSFRSQVAAAVRSFRSFGIIQQVVNETQKYGQPTKVEDVLENRSLANIIAVSILIIDSTGRIGIVERTTRVAVSSGNYGATCAGTVSNVDFDCENPFLSCSLREIKEELNLDLESLNFDGIVVPKQKMQPIFLYHASIDQTWEELLPVIQEARDISFETQAFYAVPVDQAITFASHSRMTDTAAYQIWRYAVQNSHSHRWYTTLLFPFDLSRYLVPWKLEK
ncbi:NUDIX hydrolase [Paenactinomyces guangxiensis]|uniref:NUDIX hydrolase n=1 Tax=Paenactinomyces guangxiensis TaxID=1490290 RepID=A0A7W2A9F9_9BACL|nr:NUDIX hydrolase [Paenactinomyces guangxiensis]MBA4496561.1 NUDIX hydrolase [Paenactinomyces guangxiensis]MBH8593465.1 NUDIX hydrolase [Paenactinomyces guangxiensis]